MLSDKDNNSGQTQNGESSILRNVILLALPLLSFQLKILGVIKQGLEKDKEDKPGKDDKRIQHLVHLVVHELHALMMIFDPLGKVRANLVEDDLKKKLEDGFAVIFDKLAAGSLGLIAAQEAILNLVIELLSSLKNANKPKNGPSRK